MIVVPLILVLCSGLAHAVWNMLAKKSTDKPVFLWAMYFPATVALLPTLVIELSRIQLTAQGWLTLALSSAMQSVYAALLAYTYKAGDLSQVYPIMRGTPTLLIPVFGIVLLGEKLHLWGWLGIGCMLIGFLFMIGRVTGQGQNQGVLLALGVGLCITTYTLIDKVNLQHLSPPALLEVTNIGFMLGLTPSALHFHRLNRVVRTHFKILWIGALLSPGSYLLFLFAARNADVSMVAPMREVGIVFGTLLGYFVLKESQGFRRITASVAVVLGIMLIASSGQ